MERTQGGARLTLTVRGVVNDAITGNPLEGGLVCLSRGHARTHAVRTAADGSFQLAARELEPDGYQLTIFAGARGARRRSIAVDADLDEDIGAVEMIASEYPPGIHGVLWDDLSDIPVTSGRVRLEQGGVQLGESGVGDGGAFEIHMTCDRPMPPGGYDLVADAPRRLSRQVRLEVAEEPTVYALGRLGLRASRAGDAR
jgi:hypothetical protein